MITMTQDGIIKFNSLWNMAWERILIGWLYAKTFLE